jgi:CheY-like chemotaxis protein
MWRILALDDNKTILEIYQEVVADNGGEVVCVVSNEGALKLLEEGGFDEVVVDWNLHPKGLPQGPYTDVVIHRAVELGLPITVRSGTDDSTGRLVRLEAEIGGRVPFQVLGKYASIGEMGRAPERR